MIETRIGDWMQTFTGRCFWPCDPRPEEVCLEDIAHALSMQCRFGGHVLQFYSVAEHSWRLSQVCDEHFALWGLLHDAAEAYLVDLPRPLKHFSEMGDAYKHIENRLMEVICEKFGLPKEQPADIKRSDDFMLRWEARDLMATPQVTWKSMQGFVGPKGRMEPMTSRLSEIAFLERFYELTVAPEATR